MEPRNLGPDEVEALAKHEVRSDDLRLGYAAQHAVEQAVEYKLARLLTLSGAELVDVELEWVCQGRAIGRKGAGRVIEHVEVKTLPPPPPACTVCGVRAVDVADVPVPGYGSEFVKHEPRCKIHA